MNIDQQTEPIRKVTNQSPLSKRKTIALLIFYPIATFTYGIIYTPYNTVGIASITAGGIILLTTYHPEGDVNPTSSIIKTNYTLTGLIFIVVGLKYALIGIVFPPPLF